MKFEIYSKKMCPFCTKAKELLNKNKFDYTEYDLKNKENMQSFRTFFPQAKTVPQIQVFHDDDKSPEYIGGYTELCEWLKKQQL